MSNAKFSHKDMQKALEIFEALNERGIQVVDWDAKEVEVQFPDGTKRRWEKFWAASYLADELNKG